MDWILFAHLWAEHEHCNELKKRSIEKICNHKIKINQLSLHRVIKAAICMKHLRCSHKPIVSGIIPIIITTLLYLY